MKTLRIFIISLFILNGLHHLKSQTIYEDFEGGVSDIPWVGLNGTYNGVISNPSPDPVNSSSYVGSYTNNPDFAFCFLLGTLNQPADLSIYNQVRLKVWSPIAPTQVLLQFNGGGDQVESLQDINVANQWVEYVFDMSAGANYLELTNIIISFNPYVLGSSETFYFDDLQDVSSCMPGGITFQTQSEIDNFPSNYPGCQMILGNLTIDDDLTGDIDNLTALSSLAIVGGDFRIEHNPSLLNLEGLNSLAHVFGFLSISNENIQDIEALGNLDQLGSHLYLNGNSELNSLNGLQNINSINGALYIGGNHALIDLTGLDNVQLTEQLSIIFNSGLTSLNGLNNLNNISGSGGLSITDNDALSSINGLNSLVQLGGDFLVMDNALLTSLQGISNLNQIGGTVVNISDNPLLSYCHISSVCNFLFGPEMITIAGNDNGCLTIDEVEMYCTDNDSDGVPDFLDNCQTLSNSDQQDTDNDGIGDVCDFGTDNNVGIGTESPHGKIQIENGSLYINNNFHGIILRSPDNACWILRIDNEGNILRDKIPCPN